MYTLGYAPIQSEAHSHSNLFYLCQGLASTMYYFAYGYLAMLTNVFAWLALVYVIFLSTALRLKKEDFKKWL